MKKQNPNPTHLYVESYGEDMARMTCSDFEPLLHHTPEELRLLRLVAQRAENPNWLWRQANPKRTTEL